MSYKGKSVDIPIEIGEFEREITLVGASYSDGETTKVLKQGELMPNDIIFQENKTFLYWEDQNGVRYGKHCYVPGIDNCILTAIYQTI